MGDKASFTKTVTDIDVWAFAGISGDFNPVHVNEEYAKNTRFGRRIAHGPVAMSLVAPVLGMMLPGPGTILVDLYTRYTAPVYPLDTITCTVERCRGSERDAC